MADLFIYGSLEGDRDIKMPAVVGIVPLAEQPRPENQQLALFDQMAVAASQYAQAWEQLKKQLA